MTNHAINPKKTLVLGIGNTLLSDEGIGLHVLTTLQQKHPDLENVEYLDGGTLSFTLAGWIEEAERLIVIDAAEFHDTPGTIRCLHNEKMDHFLGLPKRSVHEVSLLDLIDIARLCEHLPEQRVLVGIQIEKIDWGEFPSPAVSAAIPAAVETIEDILRDWAHLPGPDPLLPENEKLEEATL